jgi:hypothetical protein
MYLLPPYLSACRAGHLVHRRFPEGPSWNDLPNPFGFPSMEKPLPVQETLSASQNSPSIDAIKEIGIFPNSQELPGSDLRIGASQGVGPEDRGERSGDREI